MERRLSFLYKELENLLNFAPAIEDCSKKENEMYSDMANLKDSIFDYLEETKALVEKCKK